MNWTSPAKRGFRHGACVGHEWYHAVMNIGLSIPMVGDATELVELGAIAENAGWGS